MYSKVEFRTQPLVDIYNFTPVLSIVNQSITDNSVEVRSNRKSKANDKKQNQNEETKSKYLHCQPIDHVQLSRGEITPTSDPLHDPHLTFPQKLPQDQCSNYSNNFFLSPLPSSKWDHLSSRRHCLYYVTHHNKKPKASLNVQTVQILHPGDPPMYNCLALHLCLVFF